MFLDFWATGETAAASAIEFLRLGIVILILWDVDTLLNRFIVVHELIQAIQIVWILRRSLWLTGLDHFGVASTTISERVRVTHIRLITLPAYLTRIGPKILKIIMKPATYRLLLSTWSTDHRKSIRKTRICMIWILM